MIVDTLLINGSDLKAVPGVIVEDFAEVLRDGPYRGENVVLPGRPGSITYQKVRGEFTIDIPVALLGDTRAEFLTVLGAVRALFTTGNVVTLTRRLTDPADDDLTIDETCSAEYVAGAAVEELNETNGRTVLQFINCDGGWTVVP